MAQYDQVSTYPWSSDLGLLVSHLGPHIVSNEYEVVQKIQIPPHTLLIPSNRAIA